MASYEGPFKGQAHAYVSLLLQHDTTLIVNFPLEYECQALGWAFVPTSLVGTRRGVDCLHGGATVPAAKVRWLCLDLPSAEKVISLKNVY